MFFENNVKKFRFFRFIVGRGRYGQRDFVFLEDTNDIAGTDLVPYETFVEPIATGQIVKFATIEGEGASLMEILYCEIIIEIFKILPYEYEGAWQTALGNVWTGRCDLFLGGIMGSAQMNTLLPYGRSQFLSIWIKDMQYTSSQFYFLKTFTLQLWICYLSAFLFCIMLCWCFKKCLERCLPTSRYISIEVFNFISLLFNQGGDSPGQSALSLKFILITYLGLLIIFFGSFGSLLSALLAIKKINLPFDNLDGLLQRSDYVVCSWRQLVFDSFLQNYPQGLYKIAADINNPNYCPNSSDSFLNHYESNFSCEYEKLAFINFYWGITDLKSRCGLSIPLKGKYFPRYRSLFVYSGFRYKQQFNMLILKIKSSGIDHVLQQRRLPLSMVEHSTEQNIVPIDLIHISLISYIFMLGSVCAFLIFLLEILYVKIMKQN